MPRQGARRARRLASQRRSRAASAEVVATAGATEELNLAASCTMVQQRPVRGSGADFEAALAAPGDTSEKLFKLANQPAVGFSIGGGRVEVVQDRAATEHSGGVVWETAFFLARYVEQHLLKDLRARSCQKSGKRLRAVELGAGCGLLGLSLSRLGFEVLVTEQAAALGNLRANVDAHEASSSGCGPVKAAQLTWGDETDIAAAASHGPFDLIVASDVVFATRLVDPLLHTIAALMESSRSPVERKTEASCWLCLQQRDPDAHSLLLEHAPMHFRVHELPFTGIPGFEAAAELDCVLLHFSPVGRRKQVASESAAWMEPPAATMVSKVNDGARRVKRRRHGRT